MIAAPPFRPSLLEQLGPPVIFPRKVSERLGFLRRAGARKLPTGLRSLVKIGDVGHSFPLQATWQNAPALLCRGVLPAVAHESRCRVVCPAPVLSASAGTSTLVIDSYLDLLDFPRAFLPCSPHSDGPQDRQGHVPRRARSSGRGWNGERSAVSGEVCARTCIGAPASQPQGDTSTVGYTRRTEGRHRQVPRPASAGGTKSAPQRRAILALTNPMERSAMRESDYLKQQAGECRAAAEETQRQGDRRALKQLANYYEREAAKLEARPPRFMH